MNNTGLGKKEKDALILRLSQAFSLIKDANEAAKFIVDILTKSEVERIAIRLKIAELLDNGYSYEDIVTKLRVGRGTVGVVSEWLKIAGDGYRTMLERIKNTPEINANRPKMSHMQNKYPQYHLLERLFAELAYSANKKQKDRIQKTLNTLDTKSQLYKDISRMVYFEGDGKK